MANKNRVTVFVYATGALSQLNLAIPLWVGVMSTGGGYYYCQGRNGEFSVTVKSTS